MYAFIVIDYKGRAYHPVLGGEIARFDPETNKLTRLKQTIDGKPPAADSHLADENAHPINWDISPDGKTLFAVAMSGNQLYSYDLTDDPKVGESLRDSPSPVAERPGYIRGKSLGDLVPGADRTDCRALCVGPTGDVWAAVTAKMHGIQSLLHLVRYRPGDARPTVLGAVKLSNPNYTEFTDADGKRLPWHHGIRTLQDGTVTTNHAILGVCQATGGDVYILSLAPYTLLRVRP